MSTNSFRMELNHSSNSSKFSQSAHHYINFPEDVNNSSFDKLIPDTETLQNNVTDGSGMIQVPFSKMNIMQVEK